MQDLKYALRTLHRSPGFALTALSILALGIGSVGAIFSVVDGVVLKPLPFANSDQLVRIYGAWQQRSREGVSPTDFFDYRAAVRSVEHLAAESSFSPLLNLSGGDKAIQIAARFVSAGFFQMLGVHPRLGREFQKDEEVWQGPRVVMLGASLWTRRYGGDPAILGKQITMDGQSYTVVGVLPEFFDIVGSVDIYLPQQQKLEVMRKIRSQVVIGRLKPGVGVSGLQSELDAASARLAQLHPDVDKDWRTVALPLHQEVVRNVRPAMILLSLAVFLVILIVVTNLANLMLAHITRQHHEITMRFALGASRWRVARELFAFNTLIALLGGAIGCGLTFSTISLIKRFGPADIPRLAAIRVDSSVLLLMLASSIVIGLCLAVLPICWIGRVDLWDGMKQSTRSLTSGAGRMQSGLVIAEMTLTMLLVLGAAFLLRSLSELQKVDPGFRSGNLLVTRVALLSSKYKTNESLAAFWREIVPKLQNLPGVEAAAATSELPLTGLNNPTTFKAVTPDQKEYGTYMRCVTPNYLEAMGVSLLAGRWLLPTDREGTPQVILINDVFKRDVFGDEDPVGKQLNFPVNSFKKATVVGVVRSFRHASLAAEPAREAYMPIEQGAVQTYSLAVRTKQDPLSLVQPVQQVIWSMDPDEATASFRTMDAFIDSSLTQERFRTLVLTLFSVLAVVLSSVGLYGVLSYVVSHRAREIGIRMALGAARVDILTLFLGRGIKLTAIGLLAGLAIALSLNSVFKNFLFGLEGSDPATLTGASALLVTIGLIASCVPAWRACRMNPLHALRDK